MTTICKDPKPLKCGDSDQSTFQTCNFLVNVLGKMYAQWVKAGSPTQSEFSWGTGQSIEPADVCSITKAEFNVNEFSFGSLIWSTFTILGKTYAEPFGSVVKDKNGNLYLAFRGSKSQIDFLVDSEYTPVAYSAPTSNAPSNIEVAKSWYKVYTGLLSDLRKELGPYLGSGNKITVTGHSLGSTLATLAVPEAVANNMQVYHYNSASPMVGLQSFADYYQSLTINETFRLVNMKDTVPEVPNNLQHKKPIHEYVHVGTQISFQADYGAEKKNHDPCCSYAYALWNPHRPCNPDYDGNNPPI
jgi:hypothetical protein